jgi:predicted phage baseplate assembly protein
VTQAIPYRHAVSVTAPAARAPRPLQGPSAALPQVTLFGDGLRWTARHELLASDRFAPEFVVEPDDDGTATLRFGDDVLARRPTGPLTASYRVGGGPAGNVGPETLVAAQVALDGLLTVRNPMAAVGGIAPEPVDAVRLDAPVAFRVQQRMVTDADHIEVAQRHPDVQRAVATRRWTGSWYTVFLTVDRLGGRPVDAAFKAEMADFLEPFRLAGNDLEIEGPLLVPLDMALTVCLVPGGDAGTVRAALTEAFSSAVLPSGELGFFHPDRFSFGQPVYLSAVVAAAMAVPGVDYVTVDRFGRWGESDRGELAAGEIQLGRLEVAQLDNDPSRPENGRITFEMRFGEVLASGR